MTQNRDQGRTDDSELASGGLMTRQVSGAEWWLTTGTKGGLMTQNSPVAELWLRSDQWRSDNSEVTSGGVMIQQESGAEWLRTGTSGGVTTQNSELSDDSDDGSGAEWWLRTGTTEERGIRRGTSDVLMTQNRVEGRTDDSEQEAVTD